MSETIYEFAIEIHRSADGALHLGDHQIQDHEWILIRDAVACGHIIQTTDELDFDIHHFRLTDGGRAAFNLPRTSARPARHAVSEWMQRLIGRTAR